MQPALVVTRENQLAQHQSAFLYSPPPHLLLSGGLVSVICRMTFDLMQYVKHETVLLQLVKSPPSPLADTSKHDWPCSFPSLILLMTLSSNVAPICSSFPAAPTWSLHFLLIFPLICTSPPPPPPAPLHIFYSSCSFHFSVSRSSFLLLIFALRSPYPR